MRALLVLRALRCAAWMVLLPAAAAADEPRAPSAESMPPAARVEQAQRAMEIGLAHAQAERWREALREYQRAIEWVPQAPVPHRYAAEALEKLDRFDEAVDAYRTYLQRKPDAKDAAKVDERIRTLETTRIFGALEVVTVPSGADVFVDGSPSAIGRTPLTGVRLRAGEHGVRLEKEGFLPLHRTARVAAGGLVVLQAELAPLRAAQIGFEGASADPVSTNAASSVAPRASAPLGSETRATPWYGSWWFWTLAGAAVAGTTAAIVVAAQATTPVPTTEGGTLYFPGRTR